MLLQAINTIIQSCSNASNASIISIHARVIVPIVIQNALAKNNISPRLAIFILNNLDTICDSLPKIAVAFPLIQATLPAVVWFLKIIITTAAYLMQKDQNQHLQINTHEMSVLEPYPVDFSEDTHETFLLAEHDSTCERQVLISYAYKTNKTKTAIKDSLESNIVQVIEPENTSEASEFETINKLTA